MTQEHPIHAEARAFMAKRPDLEAASLDEWLIAHRDRLTPAERAEGEEILARFHQTDEA